jgi:hypothetical protein
MGNRSCVALQTMKSTDIPNGFIVIGQTGLPVLIDFEDDGSTSNSGTELNSDGWLGKGGMSADILALVHTVKGEERMLIKALLVTKLSNEGKSVTAVWLGKQNKLMIVAREIRQNYIRDLEIFEKNPEKKIPTHYHISPEVLKVETNQ